MATQRYISTSFWDDEWIHKLDPSEKLLYLYFMTNPLTSIAGIYKLSESRICFDTGFNENTIRHIMSKFELAKKAYRYEEWIIIPNWSKHQKVKERDNIRKGIDNLLLSLPTDVFNYSVKVGYKYIYLNELCRPLQGASEPSNCLDLDLDKELDIDSEVPASKEPDSIPIFSKQESYPSYGKTTIDSRLELLSESWMSHEDLPRYVCQLSIGIKASVLSNINAVLKTFTNDEIIRAIHNYAEARNTIDPKFQIQSFQNFVANAGAITKYQESVIKPKQGKACSCGGNIINSRCQKCGTMFDGDGNKLEF